ncbi:MAG: hypothetical protein ACI909_001408 [Planctomycetota bacterium]|jgi:hypothetical protein
MVKQELQIFLPEVKTASGSATLGMDVASLNMGKSEHVWTNECQ